MKEPPDGTLFHIEEGSEEEGSEWIYFDKEARERGRDNRVMLLETFGLITTGHEMLFLFDNQLSHTRELPRVMPCDWLLMVTASF